MELWWIILAQAIVAFFLFLGIVSYVLWLSPLTRARPLHEPSANKHFDSASLKQIPPRQIEGRKDFQMTMGLRRMEPRSWLTIDKNYLQEHEIRNTLLRTDQNRVVQSLPGTEAACDEVLELVVEHLTSSHPNMFRVEKEKGRGRTVRILATGETFPVTRPYGGMNPLGIAGRLTMEDLSILIKHGEDKEFRLVASATFFPVAWNVSQRIGWPVSKLHDTVPMWKAKIGLAVNNFLSRIGNNNAMERSAYFIQVSPPEASLKSKLFRPDVLSHREAPKARDILLRRERQTFRKLPKSDAVLFAVKTTLTPLIDLHRDEQQSLAREIRSWPDEVGTYKDRDFWGPCVLDYIECGIEG